ncbi:hypothetical protein N8E89_24370 (plasmid) [Phyllobacterium sp. A18/5-2]|uniref:hypothetical protein n=1 Tax=Phyllobacterium sp. A18/5-2 TaxID=2978392 RepID=UPI0021C8EA16|nr:hypothetical protein [Phyllobacterium sp. A18/5-2]UXN66305.1 hypothetical protein N8E89_24370 [Phyllobacterium sp. A18/5-2]
MTLSSKETRGRSPCVTLVTATVGEAIRCGIPSNGVSRIITIGFGGKHELASLGCGTVILGLPINSSAAAEKAPYIYFATSDLFPNPGENPRFNDLTIWGEPFAKNPF